MRRQVTEFKNEYVSISSYSMKSYLNLKIYVIASAMCHRVLSVLNQDLFCVCVCVCVCDEQ